MARGDPLRRGISLVAFLVILAAIAEWLLLASGVTRPEVAAASRAALRRPNGSAQLISSDPLPATGADGEMCQWEPASANTTLFAELQEARFAAPFQAGLARLRFGVARVFTMNIR